MKTEKFEQFGDSRHGVGYCSNHLLYKRYDFDWFKFQSYLFSQQ